MKKYFAPNLTGKGRLLRGSVAMLLFVIAYFVPFHSLWIPLVLGYAAAFILFEAIAGWCVLRACGIGTKF